MVPIVRFERSPIPVMVASEAYTCSAICLCEKGLLQVAKEVKAAKLEDLYNYTHAYVKKRVICKLSCKRGQSQY